MGHYHIAFFILNNYGIQLKFKLGLSINGWECNSLIKLKHKNDDCVDFSRNLKISEWYLFIM